MAEFELFCFAQSGNAYKAALMLNMSGADWQPRFVDFFKGEHRTPEYLAINEMGEVPVLRHGDVTLSQSGVILNYLAEQIGQFGPQNRDEEREILRWMLFDNHKFTSYTATLRFMLRFNDANEASVVDFLRDRSQKAFAIVEQHLGNREFMVDERPTIADISLCGYLFWPEQLDVDWPSYPHIQAWLERIRNLPGWRHPYELMAGAPAADRG